MVNIQDALDKKYSILQQQADAGTLTANANAEGTRAAALLDKVRASLMPAESQADIGLKGAQSGLFGAQARKTNTENDWLPRIFQSEMDVRGSQARLNNAQSLPNESKARWRPPPSSKYAPTYLDDLFTQSWWGR